MKFSTNLRTVRSKTGMTQKSLGEKIGVTSVTIGYWERGVRQPSFDLLLKIAEALDTSIDGLLGKERIDRMNIDEEELLTKYRQLDEHGKKLVGVVCDVELERMRPTVPVITLFSGKKQYAGMSETGRYIPFYLTPSAAGVATPIEGSDFEMIFADDSVPSDADYAVRIDGDSMEPYFKDGEMVYVKKSQELCNGEVGIFCVDGAMYCKQYYLDSNQNLHLLSANRRKAKTNVYVSAESEHYVKCCEK